jgi:small GTP-binding protein
MGLISRIMDKSTIKEVTVSLIGPPLSGKTTLSLFLQTGKPVLNDPTPTMGIAVRNNVTAIGQFRLNVIDTGGQEVFRQTYWEVAIEQSDVVIFVLDATIRKDANPELYKLMESQLRYSLDIIPETMPILVLLNKQDLIKDNPISLEEANELFKDSNIKGRNIRFIETSAKYGKGVESAIKLVLHRIEIDH